MNSMLQWTNHYFCYVFTDFFAFYLSKSLSDFLIYNDSYIPLERREYPNRDSQILSLSHLF